MGAKFWIMYLKILTDVYTSLLKNNKHKKCETYNIKLNCTF